jgi:hypothetical protein
LEAFLTAELDEARTYLAQPQAVILAEAGYMRAGWGIETKAHCHVYHAVHLFSRLQGESPENGSFIEFAWRSSGIFAEKVRKQRNWRL